MARTPSQRNKVLAYFTRTGKPVTRQEVCSALPSMHQATVYRAISELVASGTVHEVRLGADMRYELSNHHHHHIVCSACSKIEDIHFEPKQLDSRALAASRTFARVDSHSLDFFGLCKKCAC